MARDWEQQFREWGRAPGEREQTKMDDTESQIRAAIDASTKLSAHPTSTAAQGSYYNLTHVPRESDVDIRVVLTNVFFMDWSFVDQRGNTDDAVRAILYERYGISPATYHFNEFRDDVGAALVARFGPPPAVEPGDKAFNIRETRYHVDADVVATLEHRRYHTDGTWDQGVEFRSRAGKEIINWPEQQNRNGVDKNGRTGERFKAMVRALKNLRIEMDDQKLAAAGPIPSFLIECLVWNVPDDRFNHTPYYDDMKEVLRFLYLNTRSDETCGEWHEESDLKWLFKGDKGWTRAQVNAFTLAAWSHVGFTG
jgi:hypothetical protein